ncbi:MAG: hypothetical protein ABIF92_00605 [archaeon]
MSKEESFFFKNRRYLLVLIFIVFIVLLIFIYTTQFGGRLVPEGDTSVIGGEVGVTIGSPPREAINQEDQGAYVPTAVNKRHDYGLFETELKSYGFYTHDGITEFRLDIWVRNSGDNTESFLSEYAKIKKVPNIEYDVTGGNFDGADIPSGEEREGYLLFKDVPKGFSGNVTIITGHSVGFSTILGFTSQAPHTFEIELV